MTTVNERPADARDVVAVHAMFRRCATRAAVVSRRGLWERLGEAGRVTVVSAPPGSGKTVLAAVVDRRGGPGRARRVGAGRAG